MEQEQLWEEETDKYRELASREMGGLAVRLFWEIGTTNTVIEVIDHQNKQYSLIEVPKGAKPHEVYDRPFVRPHIYE